MVLSLKKNFSFALIGNLVYAACQYLILLIFIKVFPTEDVGMFIYAGAFTTPLMMALDMQLRNFYITDPSTHLKLNDYLSFRSFFNLIGVLGLFLAAIFFKPEYVWVIFLVSLIKVFESQIDLMYGVYQKGHRLDYVAYSRILRGVAAVITVLIVSLFFENLIISLVSYVCVWLLIYLFYERKKVVQRGFVTYESLRLIIVKKENLKKLLVLCSPIFLAILIDKYYLNYPRLKVEDILGVEMLGVFGSLLYFKSMGGQFISSLAQSAIPKLSNYILEKKIKSFNKLLFKMVLIGFFIGALLSVIAYIGGENLLLLLYNEKYAKYSNVLLVVLLGATITFSYIFIATALTCIRKQWVKLPISIVSFALLIGLFYTMPSSRLIDVAYIVLYTEGFTFLLYYTVFILFIKKQL